MGGEHSASALLSALIFGDICLLGDVMSENFPLIIFSTAFGRS